MRNATVLAIWPGSPKRSMGLFAVICALVCSAACFGIDLARMPVSMDRD
ncbi:hypothetical protein [Amycolatopsis sp. H20-H5]|nr:hypothetical protein [Amycolatopsis sp. H20-H5]MEC3980963.1 hypothetical protein [Amycolatopsis sp. H20-H5]